MADIVLVEGILEAMKKGESLRDAMISFYNAGYERGEIEKAARAVQAGQQGQVIAPEKNYIHGKTSVEKPKAEKQVQKFKPIPQNQGIQRVSAYGNNAESIRKIKQGISGAIERLNQIEFPNGKPTGTQAPKPGASTYGEKPKKHGAIIAIIISLVILLGLLGAVFIFKDSILDFFDKSGFFSGIFN
ncbi:MAG: hypothetical protein PVJ67_00615 [Candidatus Pacearchaeota archaeon]|jgi:hypothetical protein